MAGRTRYYKLTEGDRRIFAAFRQRKDPAILTDYYLRTEHSGTYWSPVQKADIDELILPEAKIAAQRWMDGYEVLFGWWKHLGQPEYFGTEPGNPQKMVVVSEVEFAARRENSELVYRLDQDDMGNPVFHHPHGLRLVPWHYPMWENRSGIQIIVGGVGAAKTLGKLLLMLVRMITLRNYRGLLLGPYNTQVDEMYKLIDQYTEDTEFYKKFYIHNASKPRALWQFGHAEVGTGELIGYPILDNSGKMLSITVDEAIIDQIELFSDIDTTFRDVGTRFRGRIRGRERLKQITATANTADHPVLWDWVDDGQDESQIRRVKAFTPATWDNPYLTLADLLSLQDKIGKDENSQRMYMQGQRPTGSGEHFPAKSLDLCRDAAWDAELTERLNREPGWESRTAARCDTFYFHTPPEEGETYLLAADPGWANPPERNSPCIGVWKVTHFPMAPARLVAFHWVFGNNDPLPWIHQYKEWHEEYRCLGMNGFDSTGFQAGYEKMGLLQAQQPIPVVLNSATKYRFLNVHKRIMAQALYRVPSRIIYWFAQHAKYKLPDDKLRQDIVSMGLVTAAILEPLTYIATRETVTDKFFNPDDRYSPILEPGAQDDRFWPLS